MFNSVASYIIEQLADNQPTDATLRFPAWREAAVECRAPPPGRSVVADANVLLKASLRLCDARGVWLGSRRTTWRKTNRSLFLVAAPHLGRTHATARRGAETLCSKSAGGRATFT